MAKIIRKFVVVRETGKVIFYQKREIYEGIMVYFFDNEKIVAKCSTTEFKNKFVCIRKEFDESDISLNMLERKQF